MHGDDGRFTQYHSLPSHIDEGVGRSEVNSQIA
jgi:hypothetical protein